MKLGCAEILKKADTLKTKPEKIAFLREHGMGNKVFQLLLRMSFDKEMIWDLPEGTPPFRKNESVDSQGILYSEARKLYLFFKNGLGVEKAPDLKPAKRETLFIQFLETIDKDDAEFVIGVKDHNLPYKTITFDLVKESFPGLIPGDWS